MHKTNNCNEFIKRSELDKYSEAVVKITESQFKWLLPFSERFRVITKPLNPKIFTVKACSENWAMIFLIQEDQNSEITITGYQPYRTDKSTKPRPKDELPSFVLTMRFVLGVPQLCSFDGNRRKKKAIWEDVNFRIIPVILYMQQFKNYAITSTRKITKDNKEKILQTTYTLMPVRNEIPESFEFLGKKFKIYKSQLQKDSDKLSQEGLVVTIGVSDLNWLTYFVNNVMKKQAPNGNTNSIYNSKLDERIFKMNGYNISAIRIYGNKEKSGDYMQVQVHKCDEGVFQLDYYEEGLEECQMVVLFNAKASKYILVYATGNGAIGPKENQLAKSIAISFREVVVYLRLCDFENELKEDGSFRIVSVKKLPSRIFKD